MILIKDNRVYKFSTQLLVKSMQTLEMMLFQQNISTALVEAIDSKEEKRRRRRARWAYIIGLFAVVFLWRAVWDWSEMYFSSMGSFIVGLILVGIVALLQRDHVRDLF
jgi:uncharacterized membrane protein YdcZ (DUF606 family)